jgi:hypothetical protein
MILGIVVAILFGTVFCGYVCPFGAFQEWTGRLGQKLFGKKYNRFVPHKLDRALRHLRYAVLAMVLYQTAVTAKLVFQAVDPYYALFNFFTAKCSDGLQALGAITVCPCLWKGLVPILLPPTARFWAFLPHTHLQYGGIRHLRELYTLRQNLSDETRVYKKETVSDAQSHHCHK